MSPGLIKGILVTGIVFGFQYLLWGIFFLFRTGGRPRAVQSFLRGGFTITISSLAYYFFQRGFFNDLSEFSTVALFLACASVPVVLEIVLQRVFGNVRPPEPMTEQVWQQKKVTKRQVLLLATLVTGSGLLTAAIVFRIVAPEVLELHWWFVLIVTFSLVGFVFALRHWNENERKFGSQNHTSK